MVKGTCVLTTPFAALGTLWSQHKVCSATSSETGARAAWAGSTAFRSPCISALISQVPMGQIFVFKNK